MSIVVQPLWQQVKSYFKIEVYARDGGHKKPRVRIEVLRMPPALEAQALGLTMPCVACGADIHPIRSRKPPGNKRGAARHAYYAPCCPLSVNVGCSRGGAARDEYIRVKHILRPDL